MIVGIDLGTTNSAVAVWRDAAPALIPNALGDFLTPSVVSMTDSGDLLIGRPARDRQIVAPERSTGLFKRYMGTRHRTKLGRKEFEPEELSALILRALKEDAEAYLGEPLTGAVVTVPAYFNDKQRKATRRAGELAGIEVRRLLNEPTAAALAFGILDKGEREPFLVFDLGGGTFDVSIVEMFSGIVEVRASAGDNRLGGEDFNDVVAKAMRPRIDPDDVLSRHDPAMVRERLRAAAEQTRRALTEADSSPFAVVIKDERFEAEVTAAEFEELTAPLLARLRDPVLRSMRDSGIRIEALSDIVLVGGATRMPVVRRAVTKMFGRFPNHLIHPDHAVALGAAVQAGLVAKDAALGEIRLTDVCPFTLGVEHAQWNPRGALQTGLFSPIIERNTPIPVSRANFYSTVGDQQRKIELNIYQGESRTVADNVKLGSLKIPVPPRPAGEVAVECRFSYDTSGLLEVDVHVPLTDFRQNMVIADDAGTMTDKELNERRTALAGLKIHPREDAANQAALARAARCFESFIGERRDAVGQWIIQFEAVLDGQDPRAAATAREELEQALDALEGERYL